MFLLSILKIIYWLYKYKKKWRLRRASAVFYSKCSVKTMNTITFLDLLVLQLLRPDSSNLQCLHSTLRIGTRSILLRLLHEFSGIFIISSGFRKTPLILVSLDGFRADYLTRNLTPTIQRLANCGVHTPYMRSVYPTHTFPNHYTIVTVNWYHPCFPHLGTMIFLKVTNYCQNKVFQKRHKLWSVRVWCQCKKKSKG